MGLPIQVRESALVHAIERVTQYGLPTTCAIENNKVRTFDKMVYDYALNNCEHVAFRDCTANPKVMVTLKKTPAQHIVKAVIDHNKYELELVRGGRGRTTGTLKVNGQVMQPMAKVSGRTSLFEDKSNRVVLHEDGVFEIFSLKYGMAVLADHEAVEVKTFQWALRNLACGLCGDMNDEKRRPEVRRKMRHVSAQAGCFELHGRGRPVRGHSCSAQACLPEGSL